MKVGELMEMLKDMDANKEIKVWRGPLSVGTFDVYFEKEDVWDSTGTFLREVYVMYGDY